MGLGTKSGAAWQLGTAVGVLTPVVRVELWVGLAEWEIVSVQLGWIIDVADVVSVEPDVVELPVGPEI